MESLRMSAWLSCVLALSIGLFSAVDAKLNGTALPIGFTMDPRNYAHSMERHAMLQKEHELRLKNASHLMVTASTCEADLRSKITPCTQFCSEWCWATTGAMLANYYLGINECKGYECAVVSETYHAPCCPAVGKSCSGSSHDQPNPYDQCNTPINDFSQLADSLYVITKGRKFTTGEAMTQQAIDAALMAGNPIEYGVMWSTQGGHALFIGGCSGGKYFIHDPWGWYPDNGDPTPPTWQTVDYSGILTYQAPDGRTTGRMAAHLHSVQPGPTPPNPPSPKPTPKPTPSPTPTPRPTPAGKFCLPDANGVCGADICAGCCKSYLRNPSDCSTCVDQVCPKPNVCSADKQTCNTCSACCKEYLGTQSDCDGCAKTECGLRL